MSEGPLLLALDTSTPVGSVAVGRGTRVLAEAVLPNGREHAVRLIPAIQSVLAEAGVERQEVDGVIVGKGPGSFTGVRIAAATARGVARGLGRGEGRPLWAWSSLAAAAASDLWGAEAYAPGVPRLVLFDARGDRVYAGAWRFGPGGMETLLAPRATTVVEILDLELPENTVLAGDGASRHRERLEAGGCTVTDGVDAGSGRHPGLGWPSGRGLLRVHAAQPASAPFRPEDRWEPEYLRSSSAQRPRVKR